MKKTNPFAFLIIALALVNCSGNKTNHDKKSEFNDNIASQVLRFPESGEDTLKTSYFADTVIYIPLETTKESLVGNIFQIWMNDSVFIFNCFRQGLLMFQKNGKFVRKIGKQGRGPGEYGDIHRFDVIRDTIYVSSTGRRGFLRYTFDGTFCDEIKFNYQPFYFSTTADQKLTCYVKEEGKVLVYNKNLYTPDTIVVEYGVTKDRYYWTYGDPGFMPYLQKTPSGLLFYDYMSDTVWNITNYKKEPAFIINMENKLPRDKQIEFCKGDLEGWSSMAKSYQSVHLIPFPSMMFILQQHYNEYKYNAIYLNNTKTGESKKFNTFFIYDDIVGKQRLRIFYSNSTDYLVTYLVSQNKLKELKSNIENIREVPSPLWLEQMKNVKEDDNMILAIIKLKKNLK
jgi:hypothetical protein